MTILAALRSQTVARRMMATLAAFAALLAGQACAQDWKPMRSVELTVPSGPGAALDAAARKLGNILEQKKLVSEPVIVVNRSGGSGAIAIQAVAQHPGDAHYLSIFTTGMINARAIGTVSSTYDELTPVAVMFEEAIVVAVRADSPIRDAREFAAKLKAAPDSLSIGLATSVGNHIHVGVAKPLQTAGVDVAKLRMVPFRSSAESMAALLGGHIDAISASTPNVIGPLEAGQIRVLAVATAQRLGGVLSGVPTWTELGIPAVHSSVQGVLGPKNMTQAQIKYWEDALRMVSETQEWQRFLGSQNWKPHFMGSQEMSSYLAREYETTKTLIDNLKLASK